MRINIFCAKLNKGISYLEDIMKDLDKDDIVKRIKTRTYACLELKDGTIYQVILAVESSRGTKCNFAFIDIDINTDIVQNIIYPSIIYSDKVNPQTKYY